MKILLATYWSIPHLGGVWSYMSQLKNKLEMLGHEVDVLGYDEDNLNVHMVNQNKKLEREKLLPLLQAKLNKENYPEIYENKLIEYTEFHRYVFELGAAYFGLDKYDLIHTQDVISTACINRVRPSNVALVATLHGSIAKEIQHQLDTIHKSGNSYMAKSYYEELERNGATAAEITVVANNWLKEILVNDFNVPNDQLKILHYGFDTEGFKKNMMTKSLILPPQNKKVIIYTGRLTELKGVRYLLVALGKLKKVRQDWVCWIVGSGDEEEKLRIISRDLGLEDYVHFLGKRDDVPSLLGKSDIFVLPTLLENQPLSLIEAQIAGKACIVSDVGGLPEMVEHKVTGMLTPPANSDLLYRNLLLLLNNEYLLKKLGSNARKWGMTHWSIDRGIEKLWEVYEEAILIRKNGEQSGQID
ncbi:glycosyltransferase family 1 protein [Psychrobacillus glaciei]|uniref:Glycosyltransferase family 1 protein n=1 Tax=Psychrobacillus glaciei TaxID=2283160 RepID=A0A5J6SUH4_9BACI|nr:glycosyltransferase family 4 protein [Psychrobacillus glaciei]QFG00675.1 glycosyltransferase family 1 protein [Psychrobacillus glaciei]